jgi:ribosomal protein S18 acetylase RimI-like enzyme
MGTTFASTDLAARIEGAEAQLSRSIGRAVCARDTAGLAFVEEIGSGVAVYTGPASPMNKMIGIGFGSAIPEDCLQRIEEKFDKRDSPLQAEVSTLADPEIASRLTRRGYVLQGFENVLGKPIGRHNTDGDGSETIDIELSHGQENHQRWLDVAITGFLSPDLQGVQAEPLPPRETLQAALGDFTDTLGFRRYVARINGEIAGVATVRFDSGLAQLCGAATLPAFRRRGVQTALLQRRLRDAVDAGCDLALLTTQPGSKSQQNGHRQGFELLFSRALLVKTWRPLPK